VPGHRQAPLGGRPGRLQLTGQQQRAGQDALGPGFLASPPGLASRFRGLGEQGRCRGVVSAVGLVHPAHGHDPGQQRLIAGGFPAGFGQRQRGGCVPARLHVHEGQFAEDVRRAVASPATGRDHGPRTAARARAHQPLAREHHLARSQLRRGQRAAAACDQGPQEELLRSLVQRVKPGRAPRHRYRGVGVTGGQQTQRLPSKLLPAARRAVQAGQQQPGVEPRAIP
jgi:hypothetical protein